MDHKILQYTCTTSIKRHFLTIFKREIPLRVSLSWFQKWKHLGGLIRYPSHKFIMKTLNNSNWHCNVTANGVHKTADVKTCDYICTVHDWCRKHNRQWRTNVLKGQSWDILRVQPVYKVGRNWFSRQLGVSNRLLSSRLEDIHMHEYRATTSEMEGVSWREATWRDVKQRDVTWRARIAPATVTHSSVKCTCHFPNNAAPFGTSVSLQSDARCTHYHQSYVSHRVPILSNFEKIIKSL